MCSINKNQFQSSDVLIQYWLVPERCKTQCQHWLLFIFFQQILCISFWKILSTLPFLPAPLPPLLSPLPLLQKSIQYSQSESSLTLGKTNFSQMILESWGWITIPFFQNNLVQINFCIRVVEYIHYLNCLYYLYELLEYRRLGSL